jgi:hypothetical protein
MSHGGLYGTAGEIRHLLCSRGGRRPDPGAGANEETRRSEEQAATIDADTRPVVLHLKHAEIAPPLTFICRRCGVVCQWEEPHGFDCQGATTEQQRTWVIGDKSETGKK